MADSRPLLPEGWYRYRDLHDWFVACLRYGGEISSNLSLGEREARLTTRMDDFVCGAVANATSGSFFLVVAM